MWTHWGEGQCGTGKPPCPPLGPEVKLKLKDWAGWPIEASSPGQDVVLPLTAIARASGSSCEVVSELVELSDISLQGTRSPSGWGPFLLLISLESLFSTA